MYFTWIRFSLQLGKQNDSLIIIYCHLGFSKSSNTTFGGRTRGDGSPFKPACRWICDLLNIVFEVYLLHLHCRQHTLDWCGWSSAEVRSPPPAADWEHLNWTYKSIVQIRLDWETITTRMHANQNADTHISNRTESESRLKTFNRSTQDDR